MYTYITSGTDLEIKCFCFMDSTMQMALQDLLIQNLQLPYHEAYKS